MNRIASLATAIALFAGLAFTGTTQAQPFNSGFAGPNQASNLHLNGYPGNGFRQHSTAINMGNSVPFNSTQRQQFPAIVTSNQLAGYDRFGRPVTTNTQVDNTAFDIGRNQSMNNGSRRWVNRPVYDQFGRVSGYEQGYIWNNSFTGQQHGNTQIVTQNQMNGGIHVQNNIRSARPRSGSIHVQNRVYGSGGR